MRAWIGSSRAHEDVRNEEVTVLTLHVLNGNAPRQTFTQPQFAPHSHMPLARITTTQILVDQSKQMNILWKPTNIFGRLTTIKSLQHNTKTYDSITATTTNPTLQPPLTIVMCPILLPVLILVFLYTLPCVKRNVHVPSRGDRVEMRDLQNHTLDLEPCRRRH